MYYAQLNKDNICVAVSQLSAKVEQENMIELESYDTTLCGKKYNDGKWEEVPVEPTEPEPTDTELLMQALTDLELRSLEEQKDRQLLAQQVSDLELAILGGVTNV